MILCSGVYPCSLLPSIRAEQPSQPAQENVAAGLSPDRFSPPVDEQTGRFHDVLKIRFDELVRARLWVHMALDRIENVIFEPYLSLTVSRQRRI